MKLKKNTPTPLAPEPTITVEISEAVAASRVASRAAFDTLVQRWRHTSVDTITWDPEHASLTIESAGTVAALAVPNRYHGAAAEAMVHLEPTRVFAALDESEVPASLKVYLSCGARPDWNICLRPEAAVLA